MFKIHPGDAWNLHEAAGFWSPHARCQFSIRVPLKRFIHCMLLKRIHMTTARTFGTHSTYFVDSGFVRRPWTRSLSSTRRYTDCPTHASCSNIQYGLQGGHEQRRRYETDVSRWGCAQMPVATVRCVCFVTGVHPSSLHTECTPTCIRTVVIFD